MDSIVKFFDSPFFIVFGGIMAILMIMGFLYTMYLVIRGIFPVWYRLGTGLSQRKIAIFATTEYESLKNLLIDSKIFKSNNILQINGNDLKKAENESVYLVHWKDYKEEMSEILRIKKDSTALIVYAPQNEGRIDQESLDKINNERNSIVVNFRGRLLNDVLISLITTSYDRD